MVIITYLACRLLVILVTSYFFLRTAYISKKSPQVYSLRLSDVLDRTYNYIKMTWFVFSYHSKCMELLHIPWELWCLGICTISLCSTKNPVILSCYIHNSIMLEKTAVLSWYIHNSVVIEKTAVLFWFIHKSVVIEKTAMLSWHMHNFVVIEKTTGCLGNHTISLGSKRQLGCLVIYTISSWSKFNTIYS